MPRNIVVEEINHTPIEQMDIEIVERKGLGHPDSIADGIAESVSRALCRMYLEQYERILHHNTDQAEVVGGQSAPRFGGGVILEPCYILISGRATTEVNGKRLPYRKVAVKAAYDYLKKVCSHLDPESDVMIDCMIGRGSVDLRKLYDPSRLLSNDTSFGVGCAPLSETEKLTLETEKLINGPLKKKLPALGEDVKVMAYREKNNIRLTTAVAMVDSELRDKDEYLAVKEELRNILLDNAAKLTNRTVTIEVNTADNPDTNLFYLTVTGLSMENGDDGSVGRGNRVNGLITPCRPISMEASAGKNPVTHVGKLYNIIAYQTAQQIVNEANGDVVDACVRILSQIGKPIDQPQIASVQLILAKNMKNASKVKKDAFSIMNDWLENIGKVQNMILRDEIPVF